MAIKITINNNNNHSSMASSTSTSTCINLTSLPITSLLLVSNISSLPTKMDSKKSNKISDVVRLQQILKKWRKAAASGTKNNRSSSSACSSTNSTIKFIKRTLSFSDVNSAAAASNHHNGVVPKGYLAVCVGKDLKRYVIPTEYLGHQAFGILLREAEEEFGFQQQGVLKIPCEVPGFEKILKLVEEKKDRYMQHNHHHDNDLGFNNSSHDNEIVGSYYTWSPSHHSQMCR